MKLTDPAGAVTFERVYKGSIALVDPATRGARRPGRRGSLTIHTKGHTKANAQYPL